ncbi:MAG: ABC transporter substrate-binding protein [Clostridia bacterium]|nr:ABC transporter substrate-binding protein [Clostridia bacterium]
MKKVILRFFPLVLTACILPLVGLGKNVEDSLVLGVLSTRTTETRPLNPAERDMVSLYGVVYESLVTVDDSGKPQPLLAESWTETGNGKTWTFTLRDNITFSDGTDLMASDVAASCQYILDMANNKDLANNGFYQNMRYLVDSVKATDSRTVVVKAKRAYYGLLYCMTFPVVPAALVDEPNPPGTGPYVIHTFEAGEYMLLLHNQKWWQTEPQVKEIMVNFYKSNKEMITAYEYGRVDAVFTRSVAAAQYKSGISSLSISYSTRQLETLMLNHKEFPLGSLKVRRALRYAIDTKLISQNVYMGMTIDANTPVSSESWLYYDQENQFLYNPEKAMELLTEEGWSDSDSDGVLDMIMPDGTKRNLHLRLFVYEDPENNVRYEAAERIKDMLAAVKVQVKITRMDYHEMKTALEKGSFDMALCAFQMDVVPDCGFFLIKGNEQNYCRYVGSDMTSLFNTLRTNQDSAEFAYTSQAIQQQFAEDRPFICLFYRSGAILTRKMFTTVRSIREFELLRGIESFGR